MFLFKLFSRKTISDIPSPPLEELRKRARILVVDDDENSFPVELLKKEGYAIDYWPKIESLSKLERGDYDIIILDIGGVAKEYSSEDGLGVLEHLKEVNPSQIVVAFSGQSFDLSKNRFWQLADDSLSKPVDATKCKRMIDNLLQTKMTLHNYWQAAVQILKAEGVSDDKIKNLEKKVVDTLQRKEKTDVQTMLNSVCNNTDIAVRLIKVVMKIIAIFG